MTTRLKKKKPKNCTPISSSITTLNDLHDDILVQIITKLSIKDIFRSMPVSKSWCTLISTRCIPTLTESPPHALIFPRNDPWSQSVPYAMAWLKPADQIRPSLLLELCRFLPSVPSPSGFLDCCNGLLLFFDRSSKQYYVCNPATQQYVSVPCSFHQRYYDTAALVFDPHCRLVIISTNCSVLEMSIFSLQTRQWDVSGLLLENPISLYIHLTRLVFANGSLYALSEDARLLKFDIKQPSVRVIELPEDTNRTLGCIGMSQGSLHYAWDDDETEIMVWVLRDEWVLKYTLDYPYFAQHPLCSNLPLDNRSSFSVYAFHPTSDVLFVGTVTEIYQYDPCAKKLDNVCSLSCGRYTISWVLHLVFPYSVNLTALEVVDHYQASRR